MKALTSLLATELAQSRTRSWRFPAGCAALMRQEAIGVLSRLPEMMKAGAKMSSGFVVRYVNCRLKISF